MILGIGNDLTDIRRIEKIYIRFNKRFEKRCFTKTERNKAHKHSSRPEQSASYAKRFAAKEACVKALGTGFTDKIFMKDIGITEDNLGRPIIKLTGGAREHLQKITPENMRANIHLSLSDDFPYAQAFVVIEALG